MMASAVLGEDWIYWWRVDVVAGMPVFPSLLIAFCGLEIETERKVREMGWLTREVWRK